MDWFLNGDYGAAPLDPTLVLLSLLLSVVCGHIIAWTYMLTHTGLSYSRSFANSLILMPAIVALVIMLLSNNPIAAFGLLGVLTIVRFRNVLRDTFDTTFLLSGVALGLACGSLKFATAIVGCLLLSALTLLLWYTEFGTRHRFGLMVSLDWSRPPAEVKDLDALLMRHCRKTHCASRRMVGQGSLELSYRVLLRDPERADELLAELRAAPGVSRLSTIDLTDQAEV